MYHRRVDCVEGHETAMARDVQPQVHSGGCVLRQLDVNSKQLVNDRSGPKSSELTQPSIARAPQQVRS
jgi:hypothetical protein